MVKTTLTLLPLITLQIFTAVHDFQKELPVPAQVREDTRLANTRKALFLLGRDPKHAEAVYISATAKGIDPVFWACNIETESEYNIKAKSRLGYKGLGQTPKAAMKTGYEVADLMYAACIYDEKLKIAKGDPMKALTFYKGNGGAESKAAAKKVFDLYAKIKTQMKETA